MSQRAVTEQSVVTSGAKTTREARYVAERLQGKSKYDAMKAAGFSEWIARVPSKVETPEIEAQVEALSKELVNLTINEGLLDAVEIHEYLSECHRADMRDIRNDDGSFRPQSEWPPIWGRMMEAGDCEVEKTFARSTDGHDKEKQGGWDESGTITKVKLKFASRVKLLELAMKHRGVNAMVQPPAAQVQVNVIDAETVQLATLLSPEQLEQVRQKAIAGSSGVALDVPKTVIST